VASGLKALAREADVVDVTEDMTEMTPAFAREVGERLRDIRRQQRLSLQAVEEQSDREFKASVLGAYERGERVISVLRLQRLANLYSVPVDQLLPRNGNDRRAEEDGPAGPGASPSAPVRIDLSRLEGLVAPERDLLRRYIGMIQIQRGDFNGRLITIRGEDVRALARVFGRDEATMRTRLDELGIAD
jgi:transcriptional regulator with XRE-family HTH domain